MQLSMVGAGGSKIRKDKREQREIVNWDKGCYPPQKMTRTPKLPFGSFARIEMEKDNFFIKLDKFSLPVLIGIEKCSGTSWNKALGVMGRENLVPTCKLMRNTEVAV